MGSSGDRLQAKFKGFVVSGPSLAVLFLTNLYFEYNLIFKGPSDILRYGFLLVTCTMLVSLYFLFVVRPARREKTRKDKHRKKPRDKSKKQPPPKETNL